MTGEIALERAKVMESHRQALIDAALDHEMVLDFLTNLKALLVRLNRNDVKIITETWLGKNGVTIRITLEFEGPLYPGQASTDPAKDTELKLRKTALINELEASGIVIGTIFVSGQEYAMTSYFDVLRITVSYSGEILPDLD